ncbi:MAG: phosphate ABC transporter permease PstA [Opitutales bacterium]
MDNALTDSNKFAQSRPRTFESLATLGLRLSTYGIIAVAGLILLHITYYGAPVIFQFKAPFVNLEFLTGQPQTLHVYEPKVIAEELHAVRRDITELESAADPTERKLLDAKRDAQEALYGQLKEQRLQYSDSALRQLEKLPDETDYIYTNYAYSAGGIGPAIVGTLLLITGSIVIAIVLGISSAIYLSEYSRPGLMLTVIRLSVLNLSGVPSIVFGLFGFGIFVLFFGWGVSLIAGWFTLAIMALPIIIASCEESLEAVPREYREASLGLGASKWTAIRTNVLPSALPGIVTTSIMAIARVAGEAAPILFTGAVALRDQFPWEGLEKPSDFFLQSVMALPYHIYVLSAKIPQNEYTRTMQYGAAFVFLVIVGFFALSSIILRIRYRKKYRW